MSVFGALDLTGELSCMTAERKRSGEFLEFLRWLNETIYADAERLYLFLDNCSIHKTRAVCDYLDDHRDRLTVIWNATYAPNLNDIERVWGQLKRASLNNYFFETVENLEDAILAAVGELNRRARKEHRKTMSHSLSKAA